jgi:hypothetical protein
MIWFCFLAPEEAQKAISEIITTNLVVCLAQTL